MDEELFPANYSISKVDKEDGNYDSGSECEDDEEEEQAIPAFTAEEEDLDVYEVDDERGTLVTDETKGMFTPILDAIAKRTPKMLHDLAWLAFVCSIRPDIVEDAKVRIAMGLYVIMIEDCVRRLLSHDVDRELDGTIDRKIDLFCDELTHFQNCTGPFAHPAWFNSSDCINGRSAVWHSKYSHNHTQVFGPIACRATARIGCSDKLRKQGTLYTSANIHRARIKRDNLEKPNCDTPDALWGDDDEQFDLGLEKWGVNVEELKKPLGPRRVFKCWVEDWEMSSTKLNKQSGWHAMGEPPDYKGDGSDDEVLEPFAISEDVLIELIKTTEQPEILNVRFALNEEEGHDSDGTNNESVSS
ncbi:LOW QUALITY PROTEIN: hypothetical protein ACHAW5_010865 [Stephanodiscus triporus]|uniref:Uncharacterized protein n=1 Tax=Stephanodiscus triporus TaxID=2934178 RepID=A0ABD3MTF2_9STRA